MPNWLWYKHSFVVNLPNSFEEVDVLGAVVFLPAFALALATIWMPFLHSILVRLIRILAPIFERLLQFDDALIASLEPCVPVVV